MFRSYGLKYKKHFQLIELHYIIISDIPILYELWRYTVDFSIIFKHVFIGYYNGKGIPIFDDCYFLVVASLSVWPSIYINASNPMESINNSMEPSSVGVNQDTILGLNQSAG